MKKVLIFGYSVTADKAGFAFKLAAENQDSSPFHVDVCGLGGFHPFTSAYLLPQLLDERKPDVLILEVTTGAGRSREYWEYLWSLCFMVEAALRRKIPVAFVHMYRNDVRYGDGSDAVMCAAETVADMHSVPVLHLAEIVQREGVGHAVVRDEVHTTAGGATWYADKCRPFIAEMCKAVVRRDFVPALPDNMVYSVDLASGSDARFDRSGFDAGYVQFAKSRTFDLGGEHYVNGLMFIMGPDTGIISVSLGGQVQDLDCYDKHCYYTRFNTTTFDSVLASKIVAKPKRKDGVQLLKGEAHTGPVVGKICSALCSTIPLSEIEALVSRFDVTVRAYA